MKVLFVYTEIATPPQMRILLEIGTYSKILKSGGLKCALLYIRSRKTPEEIIAFVENESPDALVFYSTSEQFSYIKSISRILKERFPAVQQICTGPAASFSPNEILSCSNFNAICFGEAESALVEYLKSITDKETSYSIRNLWVRTPTDKISQMPLRPLEENLDNYPFPDRDILDHKHLMGMDNNAFYIIAGRGSFKDCIFSIDSAYKELYNGKGAWFRVRSPENIINEIKENEQLNIRKVVFLDSNFIYSTAWVDQMTSFYKKEIDYPFYINVSPGKLEPSIIEKLRDAGCMGINLAIESGNKKLRTILTGSKTSNEELIYLKNLIRENEIELGINVLFGIPEETPDMLSETIALVRMLKPDKIFSRIYYPLHGTPLEKHCRERGLLSRRKYTEIEPWESVLDLPDLTPSDLFSAWEALNLFDNISRAKRWVHIKTGEYNFINKITEMKLKDSAKSGFRIREYSIHGEQRMVLSQTPDNEIKFKITPGKNHVFSFGIIIEPETFLEESPGEITFELKIEDNGIEKECFKKTINADKISERDSYYEDYAVTFDDYLNKEINLIFRIVCQKRPVPEGIWCGWIDPVIVNRVKHADYLKRHMLYISIKEKEELQRQVEKYKDKYKQAVESSFDEEKIRKEYDLHFDERNKRISKLNKTILDLESKYSSMCSKIEAIVNSREKNGTRIKEILKSILESNQE